MQNGKIDPGFVKMIKYISSKNTGWFAPVSEILDFLKSSKEKNKTSHSIGFFRKKKLELMSLITRFKYRYFIKIDDFYFKQSKEYINNKIVWKD